MFQPSALSIGIVSKFYNLLKWMLPLLIAGTYIYKGKRPSKWIGLFFFMELWILLVTVYNKNYTAYAIKNLISITATACIVDIYADRFERFLNVLLLHCELCIYINLFTLIIAPNGFISRENEAYGMDDNVLNKVSKYAGNMYALYRLLDEEYNADLAAEILRLPQKLAWNYVPNKLNDKTFYSEIIGKSNYERRVEI